MFYTRWIIVQGEVLEAVRVGFGEGRAVVEGVVGGERCLFDFVRMVLVEFGSGRRRSVAWVDFSGKCFFPESFVVDEGQFRHFEDVKVGIEVRLADELKLGKKMRESEGKNDAGSLREDVKILIELGGAAAAADDDNEFNLLKRKRKLESGNDAVSRLVDVRIGTALRSDATADELQLGKRKRELESGNVAVSRLEDAKIKIEVRLADELMLGKKKRELESGNDAVSRLADHVEVGEAGECSSDGSQLSSNRRVGRHLLVKRPTAAADDPAARWPNCRPMNAGHRGFETVKRLFLARMRTVDPQAEVTSVHRFAGAIGLARARFFSFKRCAELTAAARSGKPNLVFAWHATSAEGVGRITGYGFTAPNDVTSSYGVGVHLCPVSLPDLSAMDSEPDEYGEKHVILCRVLMGNVEKVDAGSKQCRPRSTSFDNGADNLSNPKRYVVWCANMNTHILPECVLSFRSNGHASSDR
uniref:PARP catalytic domain-containing protein n=1 Tax=Kalanchoe fedtschenkoi TaxID=63787 RepID=A0A7N0ZRD5_KALFE